MKTLYCIIASLILSVSLFGQAPPVLRQALTTNTAPVNPTNPGQIPIWTGTAWQFGTNLPGLVITNANALNELWTNASGTYQPTAVPSTSFQFRTNVARQIYQLSINETNPFLWNTPGQRRVALGADALKFIVTGADNTALGDSALESHLSGINNTAAGSSALFNSTNGAQNTAVGATALFNLQTGTDNTAIGFGALSTLVSGNYNTVVGSSALNAATGIENVGIGETAGANLGIGSRNVLVGRTADVSTDTSSNAVVVGHTAKTGELGVSIGAGAGTGLNFASTRNTLVGANTRSTTGVKTNASAIGWRAEISGDNQMIFGSNVTHYLFRNLLYGFPSAAATDISFLRNDGAGTLDWSTNANNIGVTNLSVYNNVIFNGSIVSNFNRDILWTNDGVVLKGSPTGVDPNYALRFGQWVGAGAQADYNLQTNVGKFSFAVGSNVLARGMGSVSFGNNNHVNTNANWSTIAGGQTNVIGTNVQSGFIGGGGRNIIFGPGAYNSVIAGGSNNLAQILNASDAGGMAIGGGGDHQATSNYCTIAGGFNNKNFSDYAFIGGGSTATLDAHSTRGVIVGGDNNNLYGAYGVVGGGLQNKAGSGTGSFAEYGFIGGGERNGISLVASTSSHVVIGGGQSNRVISASDRSAIGGGHFNQVDQSTNAVIAGGYKNIITSAHNGQILGGVLNIIDTANNAMIVGNSNRITANYAGILGTRGTNSLAFSHRIVPNGEQGGVASFTASNAVLSMAFATAPGTVVTLAADNQVVDATLRTHIRLASDSAVAGDRTFLLTGTNVVSGAHAILEWTGTNAGELVDDSANSGAGNIRLSATWTPTQYDTLSLIFNGTDWIETARATN